MSFSSTRTVLVLACFLHTFLALSQNPDCLTPTFFKTFGTETQSEYGTVLARSSDGNLYLAGRNGVRTFIQKTSLAGNPIWVREFQISPFEAVTPVDIFEDSEGMIVGCGTQNQFAGSSRGFVFRYDPVASTMLWAHPIVSNNPQAAGILEKTPGGSYVYYQNPTLASGETEIEILDLERATGNIIPAFARRYEYISNDIITKMVAVDGLLYGLGTVETLDSFDDNRKRLLLTRLDPVNGMPVWAHFSHLDATIDADFRARDLIVDGDALVAAYTVDADPSVQDGLMIHLQKTDLDGAIQWVKRYELSTSILRVINVPDGYVLSGQRTFGKKYFVFKVDKNGEFVWGKELDYGPASGPSGNFFGPNQSIAVADSLYFTGIATTGLSDVFFWKMLSDGTSLDSCDYVDSLTLSATEIINPGWIPFDLQQLISTAVTSNVTANWLPTELEEKLVCPDCTVPDPCPEDNDFGVIFSGMDCVGGQIQLSLSYCDFNVDPLSDGLSITLYNGNPFTTPADKLTTFSHDSVGFTMMFNCSNQVFFDLETLFGLDNLQNGDQIFAVVNDPGTANTPFSLNDFPLSDLAECDYTNNMDSFTVQLPVAPTLNLGTDQTICSNEEAILNAGPGFFKYQWSNGATTQSTSVIFGGLYRVTVTDACGFQQADTIAVQVNQLALVQEMGEFCPGKSVTIRGFTFDAIGTYQETIPGLNGECDTSATFFISELPYEERIEVIYFCPFETVTINGVTYEDSGLVRDTVPSTTTCDTIVFYFLNQQPLPFRNYFFEICEGDSVEFNGVVYTQGNNFTDTLYSSGIGCDTIAYISIQILPQVELSDTIQFCPGTSVELGGQLYTQPGVVNISLPSSTGGCDTLATYTLEWLPAPNLAQTVQFCPGSSVDIGGQSYSQPGTVLQTLPGTGGGCDTLVTYTLEFLPSPTRTETLEFCEGESITLQGQTYTQPTTVTVTIPGTGNGCDTVVTYTIQYLTPPPSTLSLVCPNPIVVTTSPGTGAVPVSYSLPVASSDCVCPGNALNLTSGPASGGSFQVGNTQVCYSVKDSCGSVANCCFTVTVREELPCDTKTSGCIKYDLLGITQDALERRTYRIRVTNNCTNKLIYTAIQLPDGVDAVEPANLSTYNSPEGRNYLVRNPNFTPFYSIRFKSTTDSIANGESDVFEYTLPAQSQPTFINITTRVATQTFYPAHLNTFNCPIGVTPSNNRSEENTLFELAQPGILLFPNPTNGELFADLSRWQGKGLNLQILDSRGARVQSLTMHASSEAQAIPLASQLSAGLYFLEIMTENGEREVARFVLER
jgi:hypothetical protein